MGKPPSEQKIETGDISKYVIHEEIIHRISVVTNSLSAGKCRERIGRIRIDKTYGLIGRNYYWPTL